MSTYSAPLRDIRFTLFDLLDVESGLAGLGFADAGRDLIDPMLDEAARFAGTVLAPLNKAGDEHGVVYDKDTGSVTTAPGFAEAYRQFTEGGWSGRKAFASTVSELAPIASAASQGPIQPNAAAGMASAL